MVHGCEDAVFMRVLGDELRAVRRAKGWIREDVAPRIQEGVSLQTLASWELGQRHINVVRFVATCLTLEASPMDVLHRTWDRVFGDSQDAWVVDLNAAARLPASDLAPLRSWARSRLAELPYKQATIARLPPAAIEPLAYLCGLDEVELVRRLLRAGARPVSR